MESTSSKPSSGRRFSFQSLRSNSSTSALSQDPHTSAPQPDAGLFAHRTLLHSSRGSKPPTTGSTKSRVASHAAPSSSSTSSNGHQHQRSMPSDLSTLIGTVKRRLSFDRTRKSKPDSSSSIPAYVGTTADEDAARLYGLGPQRPLLPSPTFEQIASGMAVRSNRSSPRLPSEPQHAHQQPPPRRSSMKKPSFSTTNSSNTDFSNSVSSASSASPYSSNNIPPPLPTPSSRQLKHVTSTLASASSSSTCTSSSASFSAAGVAAHVAFPVVVPPQQQDRKSSHKLSLNFAGRRVGRGGNNNNNGGGGALAGLGLPTGNGKTNNSSISSVDSGVSWGGAAAAAAPGGGIDVSSKKAVRFSESEDGHTDATTPPLPLANSTPAVLVLDPSRVVSSSVATTKRHGKAEAGPQLVHVNSSSFADRTPKFLRR